MDQQPLAEENLPVAMPLAMEGDLDAEDADNFVNAMLLNRRVQPQQGTSFLYGMIRDQDTACGSILGWGDRDRTCRRIVDRINEQPDDVYYHENHGRTPLHEACLRCSCLHVIEAIMKVDPTRAMAVDNAGNTPLHLLLCVGVSTHALDRGEMGEILDLFLTENSLAASICNRDGNTPLHMACMAPEMMLHLESFQKILQANNASAVRVNNLSQTPLSLHCQRRPASPEVAKLLIEANPDAIHIVDGAKGWSPLHYAAHFANYDLIQMLLQHNPQAAGLRTRTHLETPLHLLCKKNINERHVAALKCLLEAEPQAAMAKTSTKSLTPLASVCRNANVSVNVVLSIVAASSEATSVPDSNNYLPIHHACEVGTTTDVIELLLRVHPEGALATTKKKDSALSLACACASNNSTAVVALLIRANRKALTEKNHYGFAPLHCVCAAVQPRMGIVQEILRESPSSIAMKSHGGESAMHIASGNQGTSVGIIELLTSQYESYTDGSGQAPEDKIPQLTNKVGNTPCTYTIPCLDCRKCQRTHASLIISRC